MDGTIIDSLPGIKASLVYAIRQQGHDIDENMDITALVGPPMNSIVCTLLAPYGDNRVAETVNIYREHYGQHGLYESVPYPEIQTSLSQLKNNGHDLFLATSKRQIFAEKILVNLKLDSFFTDIMGTLADGSLDDKSQLLSALINKHALDRKNTVMIGDRKEDIISAHNNGLFAIGVLWGYGSYDELRNHGANIYCQSPSQLCARLEDRGDMVRGAINSGDTPDDLE
nr:HAD hydrolase-like protein [Musicola keenii]